MAGRLVVSTCFKAGQEAEFNKWYDEVHIPEVLGLGVFTAAQRFRMSDSQAMDQSHQYLALYEFEGDAKEAVDALLSASGKLNMSDTLESPFMSVVEEISERVVA
ncbi:DUF4286 family protein [Myxococcota bacterium]|nr:DUF4286 family protein [Myxococcota bacterium]